MARHHRFGFKFLHPSVEASQMSMVHARDSIKMSKMLLAEESITQVPRPYHTFAPLVAPSLHPLLQSVAS